MLDPQNRYEIVGTLGTGATSRVDKARDAMIGRTVAIKTFSTALARVTCRNNFFAKRRLSDVSPTPTSWACTTLAPMKLACRFW